jgi:hypothetical protein
MAQSGKLKPTDQVRQDGSDTWQDASTLKGLFTAPPSKPTVDIQALGEKAEEINQKVWFLDLKFSRFVTPKLIGGLFAVYIILFLLGAAGILIYGIFNDTIINVALGAVGLVIVGTLNLVIVRVLMEIALVIFRIEDHLAAIRKKSD